MPPSTHGAPETLGPIGPARARTSPRDGIRRTAHTAGNVRWISGVSLLTVVSCHYDRVHELLLYSRAVTANEATGIESALTQRWAH